MGKNIVSFGNLRNQVLFNNRDEAINGIREEDINDGVIKLARYVDEGEVKTIFGIAYTPQSGGTTYTIYDFSNNSLDDVWNAINAIKGDVDVDYDSLEKIENKIKENYQSGIVTMSSTTYSDSGSTIAKKYTLYQGGITIGDIDIYKDSFLERVELVDENGRVIDDEHPGVAKYIRFVFILSDGTENIVNIPISSFVRDLEAGDGLVVDANGKLDVVKDATSEDFLKVYSDSIAIVGVQESIDSAVQRAYNELVESLNAEIAAARAAEQALDDKIADIEVIGTNAISVAKNESGRKSTVSLKLSHATDGIGETPLSINESGLTFSSKLDCGFFDSL